MPIDIKQYDSALAYIENDAKFSKLVGNLSNNDDRMRLKAYELYEDMYHNRPEHIRITLRGDDDDDDSIEIYLPSAKKCIQAINRFLGVGYQVLPDPSVEQSANAPAVAAALEKLFKREKMPTKFAQFKRYGLIKGDTLLHITGDKTKRPGTRICIQELKPEHYFPIEDPVTGECTGCYIVDIIGNPRNSIPTKLHTGQVLVRRQTYLKIYDETGNPTGQIMSDLALYEVGKWDERYLPPGDINLVQQVVEPFFLPEQINQLPVYHWASNAPPGSTFGMSELAGFESIITALNQSMSDEDLTLIMQGLGVYWTDASPPLNARGEEVEWEISPRSVVQVASGGNFGRVSGISTVQPFGDHITALDEAMQQGLGLSDVAIGLVNDTTAAESGIALKLKLAPLLANNAEKEFGLTSICDHFIYDLVSGWLPAYESVDSEGVVFITQFDDPMPKNQSKDLADLLQIWTQAANTLPIAWFYEQLNSIMGYDLDPETDFQQALDDAQRIMEATLPPPPPPAPGQTDLVASGATTANGGRPSTNGQG